MRNKQQGGNISFGHRYLLSKSSEEQWECQGLVCSWLPPKHLSSLPLFLIRAPSWVFLLSPRGATLGCDKSASAPQVTNQHSPGKNNSKAQTTRGSEQPEGSVASRKNGLHQKQRAVNHHCLPASQRSRSERLFQSLLRTNCSCCAKGTLSIKRKRAVTLELGSTNSLCFTLLESIQGIKLGNGYLVLLRLEKTNQYIMKLHKKQRETDRRKHIPKTSPILLPWKMKVFCPLL